MKRRRAAATQKILEFKNVDPAAKIALYFGFTPVSGPLAVGKEDRDEARTLSGPDAPSKTLSGPLTLPLEEKIALLRYCEEKKLHDGPQPIELAVEMGAHGSAVKKGEKTLSLEIIGANKAIAEAILIETAFSILREEGHENLSVSLNSVGDRDSQNRFFRELGAYYRRALPLLPASCRALLKNAPLELLKCGHEKCHSLANEAPKSVGFLSDTSREHLKETLEYLEELEISYQMNPLLVGERVFTSDTVFEIHTNAGSEKEQTLASGCRYNTLAKRLGWRRDSPAVGLKILLCRDKQKKKTTILRFATPKIFFLQLGVAAKLKSLKVIELLRQAGIALEHSLAREKLLSQLSAGEAKHPYSLIMGQREALEDSVIVRNNATRAQETVRVSEVAGFLKKAKMV